MTTKFEQHRIDHIKLGFSTDNFISSVDNPFEIDNHILSLNYDISDFGILNNNLYIKDNGIDHGSISGLSDNDHPQYLLVIDIDDSPVSGETEAPISSNWAYNHIIASDPHTGYRLESENHNHQSSGAQAGQLDHGLALTGLSDDDHSAYLLASDATNRTIFATNWLDLTDAGATTLHKHDHGNMDGLSDNDHSQYLLIIDIDDTPVDAETSAPISSNWAYDHIAAADPHTGYRLESADHTHQSAGAQAGQLDHGLALTGLSDDDHTQYALLAGRSGGQTLIGGIDAGDDLTLQSTSNGTKGSILFGTSVYDEVNNRLGIGESSPDVNLHITSSGDAAIKLEADTDNSGESDNAYILFSQDGDAVKGEIGLNDASITSPSGAAFTNNLANSLTITSTTSNSALVLGTDSTMAITIDTSQNVGIGTDSPAATLDVNADSIRIRTSQSPASNGTGTQGEIAWDSDFFYICVSNNVWKRVALTGSY